MSLPLLLLFLAAVPRVELVNEVVAIPAAQWRYIEINLKQQPAAVFCDYEVQSRGSQVRVALVTREALRNLRRGEPHDELRATPFGTVGALHVPLHLPGPYAVIVENRAAGPPSATIRLRITLDFSRVSTLSPRRRWTVIAISFLVFFGIAAWSGRRLLRVIRF
jgi:hypothetical protein